MCVQLLELGERVEECERGQGTLQSDMLAIVGEVGAILIRLFMSKFFT